MKYYELNDIYSLIWDIVRMLGYEKLSGEREFGIIFNIYSFYL